MAAHTSIKRTAHERHTVAPQKQWQEMLAKRGTGCTAGDATSASLLTLNAYWLAHTHLQCTTNCGLATGSTFVAVHKLKSDCMDVCIQGCQ